MHEKSKLLPSSIKRLIDALEEDIYYQIEELRMREGQALSYISMGEEVVPDEWRLHKITAKEIAWVLEAAGKGSMHAVLEQFKHGFLSVEGGHRIGICGSVAMRGDNLINFRHISSLSIRFSHEVQSIAEPILPQLIEDGRLKNTLIFSAPGGGKTTFLRDCIRCLSDGIGTPPFRVGVADERGEICDMYAGKAQRSVGSRTDIIDACPKDKALIMMLRGMNPQVLAVDEITAKNDLIAVEEVAGCGVSLIATAHGQAPNEVVYRPIYRELLQKGIFERFVWIGIKDGKRRYRVLGKKEMVQ